ncbi:MAG: SdpI family protein [Lactococcus raffinolactis]|uniref:SdpI family protein n=1 Tax=Pseudolactococcus raffinolactis TaxID=1366 RepID=UPI003995BCC1
MKYKKLLWPTVIGLLPILMGLAVYSKLPEKMPIHWGLDGEPNGYATRLAGILILPLIMVVVNVIVQFSLETAPKTNLKLKKLMLWLLPILSVIFQSLTLSEALGYHLDIALITMVTVGIIFILLGNYIPKTSQNRVAGFRFPMTLSNPDNWQKTNRLGGMMLVISGIIMILGGVISTWYPIVAVLTFIVILVLIILVPLCYSIRLARK